MKKPSYYLETSAGRLQVVKVIEVFALTGGAIVSVVLLAAVYLRDYA